MFGQFDKRTSTASKEVTPEKNFRERVGEETKTMIFVE